MKKRLLAMLLAVVLVVALLPLQSQAAEARASRYLTYYGGSAATGASSGQVKVTFSIVANGKMTRIGAEKIMLYRASDDSLYKTVWGTTGNGMMFTNTASASGSVTISAEPGVTYYCKVTAYAKNATGYDSKTFMTNTATATS